MNDFSSRIQNIFLCICRLTSLYMSYKVTCCYCTLAIISWTHWNYFYRKCISIILEKWKSFYFAHHKKKNILLIINDGPLANPRGRVDQKSKPDFELRDRPAQPSLCGPKRVGLVCFAIPSLNYSFSPKSLIYSFEEACIINLFDSSTCVYCCVKHVKHLIYLHIVCLVLNTYHNVIYFVNDKQLIIFALHNRHSI